MLEESISCSPGNNGKKSRSRRFHKSAKKKREQYTAENKLPKALGLEALYEESSSSHSGIINDHFNPFEYEKLLAAADRAESYASSSKFGHLASLDFVRLENFPYKEDKKSFAMKPPPSCNNPNTPKSPHILGSETQFGITESELVRFCDDAESDVLVHAPSNVKSQPIADLIFKDFIGSEIESDDKKKNSKSKTIVEEILADFCGSPIADETESPAPQSPLKNLKGTKSIVDEILEDFCGSPYMESSQKINSNDSTPIFRFKAQSIRTYSRLRKKKIFRRNIATDLNVCALKDNGNTSDSSSSLSVEEDLSQRIVPELDTVDLNNSVKLCENLINLNSYFSQLTSSSSKENSPAAIAIDESKDLRLSALIEEIIKIKSKSLRINWNKAEEEFLGFSDYEEHTKESNLQQLLEDEDDVLQQINCDSLCYEKVDSKVCFSHLDHDMENTLKNASFLIEKAKSLMLSGPDTNTKAQNWRTNSRPDAPINIPKKTPPKSQLNDEQLFDDIDIWNDTDCLLNYKTQKPLHFERESNDISNYEFNKHKAKCDKKLPNLTDPCSSNALKKTCMNNETLKAKLTNLYEHEKNEIEQITALDTTINFPTDSENVQDKCLNKIPVSDFVGFTTVSKKPIRLSDDARKRANEFLMKFEQEEFEERIALSKKDILKEDTKLTKAVYNVSASPLTDCTKKAHIEDSATTSKTQISLLSKQKQEQNIREIVLNEIKVKNLAQCSISSGDSGPNNNLNNTCFVGFSTASKKLISITNESKQKADIILKKFEEDEEGKTVIEKPFLSTNKYIDNEKKEAIPLKEIVEEKSTNCGLIGFSTASEKPITISLQAKRKADEIMKKFEQAEKIEEEKDMSMEKLTQRDPIEVSEEVRRKAQELLLDIEFFEEAFEDELKQIEADTMSQVQDKKCRGESTAIFSSAKVFTQTTKKQVVEGFKTASKSSIQVSEAALRRAETFFIGVLNEDLPHEFLKCIESDIIDTNVNDKKTVSISIGAVEQVNGTMDSPKHQLHDDSKTESEHTHATNDIEMKNPAFERLHEKKEDDFKDAHLHNREHNIIKDKKHRKRKHSEGSELEQLSSLITPRRLSWCERTPLNRIENGLLCKSSSLPLKECIPNSTLISRKNLLSLSKRRKIDSPGQIIESKNGPKTPEKEQHSSITNYNASSTPNLKQFFDAVSTSTPRLFDNIPTNRTNQNTSEDAIDIDFRKIEWEDSNNSFRINRTSCVDDVNVTFSQVSPSPKQRIERLKMFGEPPPISPILLINKCRPSGLRRGRSLMKP